jgi:hypothetical protein
MEVVGKDSGGKLEMTQAPKAKDRTSSACRAKAGCTKPTAREDKGEAKNERYKP